MEEKALQEIFIKILCSELNETELDSSVKEKLTPDVISALYSLSKRHDLAHIISSSLYKNGLSTDKELLSKFTQEEIMSVYRNEQMKYVYDRICNTLDEISIAYIPLKGSVIRPYYPEESMRTSCDIDILVKETDLDSAIDALTQIGFTCGERNYHDVSLYYPNQVHLELHFNIQENIDSLDAVLMDAWQYAAPVQGCLYEFSKDFFVFYMFAHISYHFLSGGCGIRPLMDIWIMEHKMGITYLHAKDLLEKAGIYQFAVEISKLVEICFSDKPKDDFSDTLLSYIVLGGVYGIKQNKIAVKKARDGIVLYALKRLFPRFRTMAYAYPVLKKVPVLLPAFWIVRIVDRLSSGKTGKAIAEFNAATTMEKDNVNLLKEMRKRLEL